MMFFYMDNVENHLGSFGFYPQLRYNYDQALDAGHRLDRLHDKINLRSRLMDLEFNKPEHLQNLDAIRRIRKLNSKTQQTAFDAEYVYNTALNNQYNPLISEDGLTATNLPLANGLKELRIGWSNDQTRGTTNPMSRI